MNFYIAKYMNFHKSKNKILLIRFYKSLFQICEALLRKMIEQNKKNYQEIDKILQIYFNLPTHLKQLNFANAKTIVHHNYG